MDEIFEFLEIERKYQLNKLEIEGVAFWTYSRFDIWRNEIRQNTHGLAKAHNLPQKSIKSIAKIVFELLGNVLSNLRCSMDNKELLIIDHERRIKEGSEYICKYTEEISKEFNSLVIEHPYNYQHKKPIPTKNILYTDVNIIQSVLMVKVLKKFKSKKYYNIYNQIKLLVDEPFQELGKAYNVSLRQDRIYHKITERALLCKYRKKYYRRIVEKVSPKAIIEVVGYSMVSMIMNELGKEYGIPTVELQHGAISQWHCAYIYEDANIPQTPDYFFAFSKYWLPYVKLPIDKRNIIPIGFPYFEEKVNAKCDRNCERENILFLSQGTIGEKLGRLAYECYQKIDKDKYHIIYKLHPGEYDIWKNKYSYFDSCRDLEVIDTGQVDLYELFKICKYQVGVYSTALYEGLGFDLKTYIYYIEGSFAMEELCNEGYAQVVYGADDLIQKLDKKNEMSNYDFWEKNSLSNMKKAINRIIMLE